MLQWPAGRLSDRIERRLVIAGLGVMSSLAALFIAIFGTGLSEIGVVVVLGLWGAGSLSFYGLCVAHAIDRTPKSLIPHVMSGLLFVWAAGSIFGPLMSGFATRAAGRVGLFGLPGVLLLVLAVVMVWRVNKKPVPDEDKLAGWSPILPTPLGGAKLDPRSPETPGETSEETSGETPEDAPEEAAEETYTETEPVSESKD